MQVDDQADQDDDSQWQLRTQSSSWVITILNSQPNLSKKIKFLSIQ
jgi:hypothetical protein